MPLSVFTLRLDAKYWQPYYNLKDIRSVPLLLFMSNNRNSVVVAQWVVMVVYERIPTHVDKSWSWARSFCTNLFQSSRSLWKRFCGLRATSIFIHLSSFVSMLGHFMGFYISRRCTKRLSKTQPSLFRVIIQLNFCQQMQTTVSSVTRCISFKLQPCYHYFVSSPCNYRYRSNSNQKLFHEAENSEKKNVIFWQNFMGTVL